MSKEKSIKKMENLQKKAAGNPKLKAAIASKLKTVRGGKSVTK